MSYSRLILKDYPDIIWPLDNINGSSSISNSFNFFASSASEYSASINTSVSDVISIPMVYGGDTSLRLTSSTTAGLSIPLIGRFSERYCMRDSSMSFWLRCDKVPAGEITIAKKRNFNNIGVFLRENYLIFRYGTSSSYVQVEHGISDLSSPNLIVINSSESGIEMIVNGISKKIDLQGVRLPADPSHASNDFMDFYGHPSTRLTIDCPSIFSYRLNDNIAKRHYVYGLGKNVNESIFFSLGGDFYSMSTIDTQKAFSAYWDYPTEWQLIRYSNLVNSEYGGITTRNLPSPSLFSSDNMITKTSDQIKFSSSSNTIGSYINVTSLSSIFDGTGDVTFFVKVRLDGTLPQNQSAQTIFSYGDPPFNEFLTTKLYNNSGSYSILMQAVETGDTASISIPTVSSSPTILVGFKYNGISTMYVAMSGSPTQTASFISYSSSFYADPLQDRFPTMYDGEIRIGSSILYDYNVGPRTTSSVSQFYGTFLKFSVLPSTASLTTFSAIDSSSVSPYSFTFNSSENRFFVRSYGNANFIIHGPALSDDNLSGSIRISSNRIEFGYPDVISGSQVKTYLTVYDYSGSIINPKTQLSRVNHVEYINNVNMSNRYLMFDIDIDAADCIKYPPQISSFYMETYPYTTGSFTDIFDDGGSMIRIYSASNSRTYLPEMTKTPTVVVNDQSGIRVSRNYLDFQFSPNTKKYILPLAGSMSLWLDSRYMNGFYKKKMLDASVLSSWIDLSGSVVRVASNSASWPQYRDQSLNLLQLSHSLGGDTASIRNVSSSNVSVSISDEISNSGEYSFKLVPLGTGSNSFISIGPTTFSSLNEGILPNRTYTAIGTVMLMNPQQSSNLHTNARRIIVSACTSIGTTIEYETSQAPNMVGSHTVSATFTVSSSVIANNIRLFNGSSSPSDIVYWDSIALYSGSTVSGSPVAWYGPYDHYNDRQSIRFYSSSAVMTASMSIAQPMTVYMVARSFGDGGWIGGSTASAPSIYVESGSITMCAGTKLRGMLNNDDFNLIVAIFNNNSSSLFVGDQVYSGTVGTGSYTSVGMTIGSSMINSSASSFLNGDISMIAVYNSAHSKPLIDDISNTLRAEMRVL